MACAARFCDVKNQKDFKLGLAWTGCLFIQREIYFDKRRRKYFIFCGFFKWASIVLPLVDRILQEETYLVPSTVGLEAINWIIADGVGENSSYECVPTVICPPCCLPQSMSVACAAKITGPNELILKPALRP